MSISGTEQLTLIYRVKALRLTPHKIGHSEDILPSQSLGIVLKKLNLTQQRQTNKLECGPMPNVMAALPTVGSALCSTPQTLADAHYSSAVQ